MDQKQALKALNDAAYAAARAFKDSPSMREKLAQIATETDKMVDAQ